MNRVVLIGLLIVNFLIGSDSKQFVEGKSSITDTIVNSLDEISNKSVELKTLIQSFFDHQSTPTNAPEPKEEECLCVPFYLCSDDGQPIVDGHGGKLFVPKLYQESVNPCTAPDEVCCNDLRPLERTPINFACGYGDGMVGGNHISGPDTAKFGQFPWTALISNLKYEYQCVGSLIHPEVVLTSAHSIKNYESYIVRVGQWNTTGNTDSNAHQNIRVKSIVNHPTFNRHNFMHDAALLFLEKPFKLDKSVNTACLADASTVSNTRIKESKCLATGWETDVPKGVQRTVMKKYESSLISHHDCEKKFRKSRLGRWFQLHKSFLCAIGEDESELCKGYGGGPLVCEMSGQMLRYLQVGITTWGLDCSPDLPSVSTKVSSIKDWIDKEMNAHNLDIRYYTPM